MGVTRNHRVKVKSYNNRRVKQRRKKRKNCNVNWYIIKIQALRKSSMRRRHRQTDR
jgi:hypothetical protein